MTAFIGTPLVFLPIFLVVFFFGICGCILWVWALVDCITKEPSEGNDKLIWILVIVLTHWIGALIYLIVRRPERVKKFGK